MTKQEALDLQRTKEIKLIIDILKNHDIYFLDKYGDYQMILDKEENEIQVFIDDDGDIIFEGGR